MTASRKVVKNASLRRWAYGLFLALFVAATVATAIFGLRTYHSLLLLRSAYTAGAPEVSSIRPWMTLRYAADTYHVSAAALIARLGLPAETDPDASVKALAEREEQSPFEYVQRVQRAVVEAAPSGSVARSSQGASWLAAVGDEFLAALLAYGYPVLGLTLLLGAIGLPVPTGLSAALAGSLAARGSMSWAWSAMVAVTASVVGDAVGYGLGRALSRQFLERHGRWLGYTPARRERVALLFDRWGGLGVLLSRTLVSHLSAVLNLLAGAGRYRLSAFLAYTVVGRILWTSAYLGLGYAVGASLEAAAGFLTNLSLLFVSLAVLVASGFAAFMQSPQRMT
jgi:membrane protein DedA with SNARE-associated domain